MYDNNVDNDDNQWIGIDNNNGLDNDKIDKYRWNFCIKIITNFKKSEFFIRILKFK